MVTLALIFLMVIIPTAILGVILARLLSDMPKPGRRVAGIGPFDQLVDLADDEHVLDQARAVHPVSKRTAYAGALAFTECRLIFATNRSWDAPPTHSIRYEDVSAWHAERRRQIGIGVVVPYAVPSIVVTTRDGQDHVYLPTMGYDIVGKAKRHLPNEEGAASG